MSEKLQHENAEIDYINAILCAEESAEPLTEVANHLINQPGIEREEIIVNEINKDDVNKCEVNKNIIKNDIDDKNGYRLFLIAGFKVAVLQSNIHAVVDLSEVDIDENILLYESKAFNVVDIKTLMELPTLSNKQSKYVLLKDGNIAFNCEATLNAEKIEDDAVCWRDENSKRRWLAGTVKKRNIILLDTMALHNI